MKVNIYETVVVSDEQRRAIAASIDEPGSKARDATRDELKAFIWEHGYNWAAVLDGSVAPAEEPDEDDGSSLL